MTENLYQQLLEEFKDDMDFRSEGVVSDITEQICQIMEDKGLNRVDLSNLLNTSKAAVTKMLNGSTNFTIKRLVKISISLNKEIDICFKEPVPKVDFNNPSSSLKESTANDEFSFFQKNLPEINEPKRIENKEVA